MSSFRMCCGSAGWMAIATVLAFVGCGGDDDAAGVEDVDTPGVDPSYFLGSALVDGTSITTEDCTLSGGTETTCYRIRVTGAPGDDHDVGPFCPTSISDDASAAGIWIENDQTYDLTGEFIADLATFYDDDEWDLVNDDGSIRVTDSQEACEAAARPDVEEKYNNYCVECDLAYYDGGVSVTFLLPTRPLKLSSAEEIDRMTTIGVALNGVRFDPPAPVDAILAAHTIAAFDDCGGHVNQVNGYHYHGATGCSHEVAQDDGHAPLLGYALDGYGMYAMLDDNGDEAADLDACRGHSDDTRGYHYHVASAGENEFIGCFHGEQGSTSGG